MKKKFEDFRRAFRRALFPRDGVCVLCGKPAPASACLCGSCRASLPPRPNNDARRIEGIARVRSAFVYAEPLRNLMHTFKYENKRYVARFFAQEMAKVIDDFPRDCMLVGVPLHEQRLKERGFCQTDELCYELSRITGRTWHRDALTRIRNTPSQTTLSGDERSHNLENAFCARNVSGMSIILVDDVVSTGSTLRECALTLRAAGAHQVYALTACSTEERPNA